MSRHLLRKIWRLPRLAIKRSVAALLRVLLLIRRPARLARSGFVLPTTALLVLMVLLTATALTYRAFTRSDQAITQREQQVIVNSATPAIDRAKAKIEFIFQEDPRFPSGVPASDILSDLMADERTGNSFVGYTGRVNTLSGGTDDPFTLPDETRVDINEDGELDNAWMFESDINGDGTVSSNEIIVYSILVDDSGPEENTDFQITDSLTDASGNLITKTVDGQTYNKASALVTRTGPLATTEATANCSGALAEGGWQVVETADSSTLQKNYQVNVFVANNNDANRTFETLEFQQSRIAARANKWGAWFRYDLEIYPGPNFNWNGAMHTDGNLLIHHNLRSHMVSSHNSCLYSQKSSEITLGVFDNNGDDTIDVLAGDFQGQAIKGTMKGDNYSNSNIPKVHLWDNSDNDPPLTNASTDFYPADDSIDGGKPSDASMNALTLFTEDRAEHIDATTWTRDTDWETELFFTRGRILNEEIARPFVDDFYRADDRWGPKPRYDSSDSSLDLTDPSVTETLGDDIVGNGKLTDPTDGLDGYWERQAIASGLRLIVGQRLELGNTNGWNSDPSGIASDPNVDASGDPLYPAKTVQTDLNDLSGNNAPDRVGEDHEYLQRRALQDNLAAVQGMAVYHYQGGGMATNGEFPLACYALTAHPGTTETIINSRTFGTYPNTGDFQADFFSGTGTNGWEFAYNADFDTAGEFATQIASTNPLGIALRNLAYFAGDPLGGAPSFPPTQDSNADADAEVHPAPYLSMWGDFSHLRRVLAKVDAGTSYNNLSFADKSTLHTAACTLGMLAYNITADLAEFDSLITNAPSSMQNVSQQLGGSIADIMECLEGSNLGASNPANRNWVAGLRALLSQAGSSSSWGHSSLAMVSSDTWLMAQNGNGNGNNGNGNNGGGNNGGGGGNNGGGGGGGACSGTGSFDVVAFLQARGDLDGSGNTAWTDPDTATVITDDNLCPATGASADGNGFQSNCDAAEYFAGWTLQDWLDLIEEPGVIPSLDTADDDGDGVGNDVQEIMEFSNQVNYFTSLIRDRDLGFREGQSSKAAVAYDPTAGSFVTWDGSTGLTEPVGGFLGGNSQVVFNIGCDPNIFQDISAGGGGGQDNNVAVGLVACSEIDQYPIKYPSLYYLFPITAHDHDGTSYHQQPDDNDAALGGGLDPAIQVAEEYVTSPYIEVTNASVTYNIVGADDIDGVAEIAAVPKSTDFTSAPAWVLPHGTAATGTLTNPDTQPFAIQIGTNSIANVGFLDKGFFDGREMLNNRVLDLDIDILTTDTNLSDTWISSLENASNTDICIDTTDPNYDPSDPVCSVYSEGVVYAFREDAVREDEIVRPKNADGSVDAPYCQAIDKSNYPLLFAIEFDAKCHSIANPTSPQDPPLTADKISLKPVDFIADPQRRPYGFRLRTASGNPADFSGTNFSRNVGMTFVTDNSLYIQGDFNLHSTANTRATIIEEFDQTLLDGDVNYGANFYNDRTTLNTDTFAVLSQDHWRPVEILTDAITILSANFNDGAVSDTFTKATPGSDGGGDSSYMNQPRPDLGGALALTDWVQVDPDDPTSPIWVDRNGTYYYNDGGTIRPFYESFGAAADWVELGEGTPRRRNMQSGEDTYVNAVFVSGLVPKRPKQGYGGLHNFPRFSQRWAGDDLFINGSFIQLNFSTASTGPFEQDAWEPGDEPLNAEPIYYYSPPNRRWGFDVGLLYAPPAPAARRFVNIGAPRSEYYRKVPADDPYIVNLRCAEDDSGNQILPDFCPS